jgi:hypothetical protein
MQAVHNQSAAPQVMHSRPVAYKTAVWHTRLAQGGMERSPNSLKGFKAFSGGCEEAQPFPAPSAVLRLSSTGGAWNGWQERSLSVHG